MGHVEQVYLVGVELSRGHGEGNGLAVRRPVRADDGVRARVQQMRILAKRPHHPNRDGAIFGAVEEQDLLPIGREFGRQGVADVIGELGGFRVRNVEEVKVEVIAFVFGEDNARHVGCEDGIVFVAEVVRDLRVASAVRVDGADLIDLPARAGEHDPPAKRSKSGCGSRRGRVGWDGRCRGDFFRLERENRFQPVNWNQPEEESDHSQKNQADGDGRLPPL